MMMLMPFTRIQHAVRVRASLGSSDVHTRHVRPITGTPVDVPVPSSVTETGPMSGIGLLGHVNGGGGGSLPCVRACTPPGRCERWVVALRGATAVCPDPQLDLRDVLPVDDDHFVPRHRASSSAEAAFLHSHLKPEPARDLLQVINNVFDFHRVRNRCARDSVGVNPAYTPGSYDPFCAFS